MSFLRHKETHQRVLKVRGRDHVGHALTHPSDESPVGYSWRVALQQSPLPLHQPAPTLQQSLAACKSEMSQKGDPTLTCCLIFGAHPTLREPMCSSSVVAPSTQGRWSYLSPTFIAGDDLHRI